MINLVSQSNLQQAFIASLQRIEPNIDADVLLVINELIAAFERGETSLNLGYLAAKTHENLQKCSLIGEKGDFKPLIKDGNYLYLARYYAYETNLINNLLARMLNPPQVKQIELDKALQLLFAYNHFEINTSANNQDDWITKTSANLHNQLSSDDFDGGENAFSAAYQTHNADLVPDLQKTATICALTNNLAIIAGGPGTGKTTTVLKILAALLMQNPDFKIALAAPTGKAAARMSEAIRAAINKLAVNDEIRAKIPQEAATIHRLLGTSFNSPRTIYHADNQLNVDVLVIDEASMLDLALISKLLAALPSQSRLILLGDSNQLSAVEAGAVFGDLCAANTKFSAVVTHLQKSHRFDESSLLGKFIAAVKIGDNQLVTDLLDRTDPSLIRSELDFSSLVSFLTKKYWHFLQLCQKCDNPADVFQEFVRFRALCAHNDGMFGAINLNVHLDNSFSLQFSKRLINGWYSGRAIMMMRNDYNLQLFNGDIGICLLVKNSQTGALEPRIFFEQGISVKSFSPARISNYVPAFVLTIHKSQGSEFDEAAVIIPDINHDESNNLLNRSLLYTAITRVKKGLNLFASLPTLDFIIKNNAQIRSALASRIAIK